MNAAAHPAGRRGGTRVVLGALVLLSCGWFFLSAPEREPARLAVPAADPFAPLFERRLQQPLADDEAAGPREATDARASAAAPAPAVAALSPPPQSFGFLGSFSDAGRTVVVLHGGGRTLNVGGTGPVDDDYIVDAIDARRVVLRHLATGEGQEIELAAPAAATVGAASADDTPPD